MAEISEFHRRIHELFEQLTEIPEDVMTDIGETLRSSIDKNFEVGGRFGTDNEFGGGSEHWIPSRAAIERQGQTLVETSGSGLRASVAYDIDGQSILIGTNKVYGAIHNFGGETGRGKATKLPARPWAVVQNEDLEDINDTLLEYYSQRLSGV